MWLIRWKRSDTYLSQLKMEANGCLWHSWSELFDREAFPVIQFDNKSIARKVIDLLEVVNTKYWDELELKEKEEVFR